MEQVYTDRKKAMARFGPDYGHMFRLKLSQQMRRMCQKCCDRDDLVIPRIHKFGSFTERGPDLDVL